MSDGELVIWRAAYGSAYVEIRRMNRQWSNEDVALEAVEVAERAVASLRAIVDKTGLFREIIA